MIVTTLFVVYNSTAHALSLGVYMLDLPLRVDLNSLGLCSLYWLWTNTYYLYTLFILVLVLLFFTLQPVSYSLVLLAPLSYTLFFYFEAFYNLSMTSMSDLYYLDMGFYNLLLNNSINKLHPALIYTSVISLIILTKHQLTYNIYYRTTSVLLTQLLIIFISLTLGGWWAYQEGSWGGWWNWDASEMFGLGILMSLITVSHTLVYAERSYSLLFKNLVYALFVYYAFLQLNFSLISHNFGIRQGDLVDFRIIYGLIFIVLITHIKLSTFYKFKLKNIIDSISIKLITKTLPIFILITVISYITTLELWASLLWKILSIDLQNELNILEFLSALLLATIHIRYISVSVWVTLFTLTLYYSLSALISITLPLIILAVRSAKSYYQHLLISLVLFYFFYYNNYSVINSCLSSFYARTNESISLNLPLLNNSSNSHLVNGHTFPCTDSALLLNGGETKLFSLVNSSFCTSQIYYTNLHDIFTKSTVLDFHNIIALCGVLLLCALNTINLNYLVTRL